MAKKKKGSNLGTIIGTLVVVAIIIVCVWFITSTRLFGSYKSEAAGSMFGMNYSLGSVTYTFSGLNKVEIESEVTIFGSSKSTQVGTYKIKDNEIIFTFKEEEKQDDGSTKEVSKDYAYKFSKGKDLIEINDTEYKKVK
ncbi:MAG: hypothetical protein K6F63_05535 [Lachnospiraceae bacterium]|nr:hypothetical protein [Lachnospiraceae bacterium]